MGISLSQSDSSLGELFGSLADSLAVLVRNITDILSASSCREKEERSVPLCASTGGRPANNITKDLIEQLRETGMNWQSIATCFGVSDQTIYIRRIEFGIEDSFTEISEGELDKKIQETLNLTRYSQFSTCLSTVYSETCFERRNFMRLRWSLKTNWKYFLYQKLVPPPQQHLLSADYRFPFALKAVSRSLFADGIDARSRDPPFSGFSFSTVPAYFSVYCRVFFFFHSRMANFYFQLPSRALQGHGSIAHSASPHGLLTGSHSGYGSIIVKQQGGFLLKNLIPNMW